MQITEYVCDECGKKRKNDTNHWRTILNYPSAQSKVRLVVGSLGMKNEFVDAEEEDVCGQDCAVKVFSRWLSTGKLKAEVPNGKS